MEDKPVVSLPGKYAGHPVESNSMWVGYSLIFECHFPVTLFQLAIVDFPVYFLGHYMANIFNGCTSNHHEIGCEVAREPALFSLLYQ